MSDKDEIKDLLREKLQSHEVMPSKGVWKNVSASLTNTAVTTTGIGAASSLLKVAVAVVGITGLSVATYYLVKENNNSFEKELSVVSHNTDENTTTKKTDSQNSPDKEAENVSSNALVPPLDIPMIDDTEFSSEDVAFEQRNDEITGDQLESAQEDLGINSETEESQEISTANVNEPVTEEPVAVFEPEAEPEINAEPEVVEPEPEVIAEPEAPAVLEEQEEIILPNVFTPNDDGVNDYFEIAISEKSDFQIIVINQSNAVVFQSNSVNFRWDGKLQSGEPAPPGNYVYFISAKTLSGADFVKSSALRIEH